MKLPEKTAWLGPIIYRDVSVREIDHKATGAAMRQLRQSHYISLREVARRMELSAPFVSDLERGNRNWNPDNVLKFMSAVSSVQINRINEAHKNAHKVSFHIGSNLGGGAPQSGVLSKRKASVPQDNRPRAKMPAPSSASTHYAPAPKSEGGAS